MPILVVDIECTCWKNKTVKNWQEMEIIEIGAVFLESSKYFKIKESYCYFVKPLIHPKLSKFCTDLTSIKQEQVDQANTFNQVFKQFVKDVEEFMHFPFQNVIFASWGDFDRKKFVVECQRHNVPYSFGKHVDLKNVFAKKRKHKPCGVQNALEKLHMKFVGNHHRGLDDALNIAHIIKEEFKNESELLKYT